MRGILHNRRALVAIALALPIVGFLFLVNYQPRLGLLYHITKADVRFRFPDTDTDRCRDEQRARLVFPHFTAEQARQAQARPTPSCGGEIRFGWRWTFLASLALLARAALLRTDDPASLDDAR